MKRLYLKKNFLELSGIIYKVSQLKNQDFALINLIRINFCVDLNLLQSEIENFGTILKVDG